MEAAQQVDVQGLSKAVSELQANAAKERQDKVRSTIIEINAKVFDKAQAYTNVIILAGYAGAFTIWTYIKANLPLRAHLVVALGLGFSLLLFILFEIFGMIMRTRSLLRVRRVISDESTPEQFFANLKVAQKAEAAQFGWVMPLWAVVLTVCVTSALFAISVLFYNAFALLIGWQPWPR
jgi:hypothetical protein